MKLLLRILFVLLAFVLGSQLHLNAQSGDDSTRQKVVIVLNDGTERIGYILSDDGREILLETQALGKIYILKSDIARITPINRESGVVETSDGEDYRSVGPFTTRYHFTTNALPIKRDENYALINLYGPEVHFAVTDRLSLGMMSTWIASPFILAVKYTIPTKNEKLNFGLGTLMGTTGYLNSFRGFGGLHWGMVTYGDRIANITFSAGYAYISPRFGDGMIDQEGVYPFGPQGQYPEVPRTVQYAMYTAPAFGLGSVFQVGKRASIIMDGMLFIGSRITKRTSSTYVSDIDGNRIVVSADPITTTTIFYFMPGMRFQSSENTAFQFALAGFSIYEPNNSYSFPVPTCSWFKKF